MKFLEVLDFVGVLNFWEFCFNFLMNEDECRPQCEMALCWAMWQKKLRKFGSISVVCRSSCVVFSLLCTVTMKFRRVSLQYRIKWCLVFTHISRTDKEEIRILTFDYLDLLWLLTFVAVVSDVFGYLHCKNEKSWTRFLSEILYRHDIYILYVYF